MCFHPKKIAVVVFLRLVCTFSTVFGIVKRNCFICYKMYNCDFDKRKKNLPLTTLTHNVLFYPVVAECNPIPPLMSSVNLRLWCNTLLVFSIMIGTVDKNDEEY